MQTPETQPGFWKDAKGRLVPIELVAPIDQQRDQLVRELVKKATELQALLADFKQRAFGDVDAFADLSAEQYDVKLGGKKGNISLLTFDGSLKIVRARQDTIVFDERLQAARALIDECLADWTAGARSEVKLLINDAFRTDTKGEIRTASVLALKRLTIDDDRWKRAMQAIGEATLVASTKSYIRFYERAGDSDQYEPISLDIAKIALLAEAVMHPAPGVH